MVRKKKHEEKNLPMGWGPNDVYHHLSPIPVCHCFSLFPVCERQCVISASMKWRLTNVGLCEGTEEISLGVSCSQIRRNLPC